MNQALVQLKQSFFLHRWWKQWLRRQMDRHGAFLRFPPYPAAHQELIRSTRDPVRYTTMALAFFSLDREKIEGAFAEVGVYRGDTSRIIHALAPERTLYLFDTFEGFPAQDTDEPDDRFRDATVEKLERRLGDLNNVVIRKGYFPETAAGLEAERFAFVMLDVDKYAGTRAGLEFFYPRLSPGGYVMIHDYHSPESDYAVSKAVTEYMTGRPERIVCLADPGGSVMFRKQ